MRHWRKRFKMSRIWNVLSNIFSSRKNAEDTKQKIHRLEKTIKTMQKENENLSREAEENKQKIRNFDLISAALKAEPVDNGYIKEFDSLKENDFKEGLCNAEPGINDAVTLRKLDDIFEEMRLIANCPELHSKNIGAIGGGFSSGKSSIINSFITDSRVKLAEGIKPVTAIPSYVISGQKAQINGISFRGGRFPIAPDMYREISHEFMESFDFDLKEIIKYTTVMAPMESYIEHLCLIDTPGYNPPGSGNTGHDFETARNYIKDAKFLIWTVGLDQTGTIPKSDINFLNNLGVFGIEKERPLYIVANKAQLKGQDDIESILDTFAETLDDNDLSWAGISAYNSRKNEIHAYRETDLFTFLAEHNKPSGIYAELNQMLNDVFSDYFKEANRDFEEKENKRKAVKKLILQALEGGNIDIEGDATNQLESGLNDLVRYFKPKVQQDERIKRIEDLRNKFRDCLNNFCDGAGIERTEVKFCIKCGKTLTGKMKFCTGCGKEV